MKTPRQLSFYSNGNVIAFDDDAEQMSELQSKGWMELYFEFLN